VCSHDDLARANLSDQVTQSLGCENHRVVVELPQVFARLHFEGLGASIGKGHAALIGSAGIGRKISAGMRSADLEPRKGIERSLKNQLRKRDRRFERVADHVFQHPVTLEPSGIAQFCCALWMDEYHHTELLGLGPERMEFRVREILAVDA